METGVGKERIEDVILRYGDRGIPDIRNYVSENCCDKAAKEIMSWEKGNVFLTTGFYVAGHAETDGPVGTVVLAGAMRKLGYRPIVITDKLCSGFFELENIEAVYIDCDAKPEALERLVEEYEPKGLISIERCGKNRYDCYANMCGCSIGEYTAPIDELFIRYQGIIPSIGIGDGGNEIGMGKIAGAIRRKLSLEPCIVSTDILVIATVSNWGAYGVAAALGRLCREELLPSFEWVREYLVKTLELGSIDGITHRKAVTVDGKNMGIEYEILETLKKLENRGECA